MPHDPPFVLIVDDDPAIVSALKDLLTDEGYAVAVANDGRVALASLRSGLKPEIILLDLMMPIMDGYAFRAEQQRDPALASIPVVILTAGTITERVDALGAAACLSKPVSAAKLLTTIERVRLPTA